MTASSSQTASTAGTRALARAARAARAPRAARRARWAAAAGAAGGAGRTRASPRLDRVRHVGVALADRLDLDARPRRGRARRGSASQRLERRAAAGARCAAASSAVRTMSSGAMAYSGLERAHGDASQDRNLRRPGRVSSLACRDPPADSRPRRLRLRRRLAPAGARGRAASRSQATYFEAPRDLLDPRTRDAALDEIAGLGVQRAARRCSTGRTSRPGRDSRVKPSVRRDRPARPTTGATYEPAIDAARARGMAVLLTVTGPVPRWATQRRKRQRHAARAPTSSRRS